MFWLEQQHGERERESVSMYVCVCWGARVGFGVPIPIAMQGCSIDQPELSETACKSCPPSSCCWPDLRPISLTASLYTIPSYWLFRQLWVAGWKKEATLTGFLAFLKEPSPAYLRSHKLDLSASVTEDGELPPGPGVHPHRLYQGIGRLYLWQSRQET